MQEAVIVDMRLNPVRSSVWLLADTRIALQQDDGNTAAFSFEDVTAVTWIDEQPTASRRAAVVLEWTVRQVGGTLEVTVGTTPRATLKLRARRVYCYLGDAIGIGGVPDFLEVDEAALARHQPAWSSQFALVSASSRNSTVSR
jgi:hypothetical protein